jgi:Tol biopolymer transport system component
VLALVVVTSVISPPASHAAFPGANGKIAFTSTRDGNGEVYVMNADGSGQTNVSNNTAYDSQPRWSPDGTKIVFQSNRDGNYEIYVMNANGTAQTRLTNNTANDSFPSWSPDGTKIAFIRSGGTRHGELWIMNADGTDETQLISDVVGTFPAYFSTAWSPDGTKIALSRSQSDTNQEIDVINADGSGLTALTSNGVNTAFPNWSPDGTKIAFDRGPAGSADIYVMNPDGSSQTNLTNNGGQINQSAAWSPDGTKIVFNSNRDGNAEIYVMQGNGTGQTRLTFSSGSDGAPDWQPIAVEVAVDIKLGGFPNSINPRSKGVIPVAILTTESFDATAVDPTTVLFGPTGTEAAPVHFALEDVDADVDTDMILHFNTQATGIQCGDTAATLTGETFAGRMIEGSDSIKTAGCK